MESAGQINKLFIYHFLSILFQMFLDGSFSVDFKIIAISALVCICWWYNNVENFTVPAVIVGWGSLYRDSLNSESFHR